MSTWAPSSIPLAGADPAPDQERIIKTTRVTAAFNGGITAPQYFSAWDFIPDLQGRLPPGPGGKLEPVVEIGFQAFIQIDDTANVQYAGFIAARIAYLSLSPPGPWVFTYGGSPPTPTWNLMIAAQGYDPVSLPVSGADYPIWTRSVSDPLAANIRLDRSGPGLPMVGVDFQIFSSSGDSDAIGVTLQQMIGPAS